MRAINWQIQITILFIFLLSGCESNQGNESKSALLKVTNPAPIHIANGQKNHAENIKHDISSISEIYDVAVIEGKKDTLVAYKVKHLQRFRMKAIEKKINKLLEEKYPDENFTVSSDYKIFLEAVKLKERVKDKGLPKKKAEKELQKIIKLKDESA
ncbi:YhcN/YlaJ family sporulation lipoprotein [Neobacillus sp. PS3-34]|uniref:YhcN/YlaJ family sporulation lipoprotein n=1 Tax=Neobacillus sp. PS3-34 TaxID=3070678 RepID=UPI0027E03176|nr:YhcN/YlaJ family sporulation lipoprotein [Neobacillus sp. PS3-34]WML49548.1 YhcN/YlaJ family sporulation lipoprotein [Neobacillus sp. PS3-34]